ncbi:MAG: methyltransferase domain-containing protein [Betaproteobacteria bacterium]|nr:methyltransferase domain-containing protein [Betaproteobacteria bacterium]
MNPSPKPPHQNAALPDFWDTRYRNGAIPWDGGGVPRELAAFVERQAALRRTLIPGCGSAYEARLLAEQGWPVTALDFSAAAAEAARATLGPHAHCVQQADFFDFLVAQPFGLIYERAFLCALPRKLWPAWGARVASLLEEGGLLAGYFFFSDEPKGPPFGIAPDALFDLLAPHFERTVDLPAADSIPAFRGRERWQVWRRKPMENR